MGLKPGNVIQAKTGTISRTDTSEKKLFALPAGAMIIGIRAFGTNSSAASTLTLGTQLLTGTTITTLATVDAAATGAGKNDPATLAGAAYSRQSSPVYVTGKWADATTTASTAGGPYSVVVEYM